MNLTSSACGGSSLTGGPPLYFILFARKPLNERTTTHPISRTFRAIPCNYHQLVTNHRNMRLTLVELLVGIGFVTADALWLRLIAAAVAAAGDFPKASRFRRRSQA